MIRPLAVVALAIVSVVGATGAQEKSPPPAQPERAVKAATDRPSAQIVGIEIAELPPAPRGSRRELTVTLLITDGYHVMSDKPTSPYFIPTVVSLNDAPGIHWGPARYPKPMTFKLEEKTIATFMGHLLVRIPFTVAIDATPGPREISGIVQYQACTSTRCLFPVKRPIQTTIEVAP